MRTIFSMIFVFVVMAAMSVAEAQTGRTAGRTSAVRRTAVKAEAPRRVEVVRLAGPVRSERVSTSRRTEPRVQVRPLADPWRQTIASGRNHGSVSRRTEPRQVSVNVGVSRQEIDYGRPRSADVALQVVGGVAAAILGGGQGYYPGYTAMMPMPMGGGYGGGGGASSAYQQGVADETRRQQREAERAAAEMGATDARAGVYRPYGNPGMRAEYDKSYNRALERLRKEAQREAYEAGRRAVQQGGGGWRW